VNLMALFLHTLCAWLLSGTPWYSGCVLNMRHRVRAVHERELLSYK